MDHCQHTENAACTIEEVSNRLQNGLIAHNLLAAKSMVALTSIEALSMLDFTHRVQIHLFLCCDLFGLLWAFFFTFLCIRGARTEQLIGA